MRDRVKRKAVEHDEHKRADRQQKLVDEREKRALDGNEAEGDHDKRRDHSREDLDVVGAEQAELACRHREGEHDEPDERGGGNRGKPLKGLDDRVVALSHGKRFCYKRIGGDPIVARFFFRFGPPVCLECDAMGERFDDRRGYADDEH